MMIMDFSRRGFWWDRRIGTLGPAGGVWGSLMVAVVVERLFCNSLLFSKSSGADMKIRRPHKRTKMVGRRAVQRERTCGPP